MPQLKRSQPVYQQVEEHVRSMISRGELLPGTRLPSNSELAESTGTSVFTVQTALACLTREGLIERKRKVGTFVTGAKTKLTCAGIYFNRDLWHDTGLTFYQTLLAELREKLTARTINFKVWIDDRTEKDQDKIFPAIKQALDRSDIQALIAPLLNPGDLIWIRELPVATAVLYSAQAQIPNRASHDWLQMLRSGLEQLRNQGCRSVGLISALPLKEKISNAYLEHLSFYECFKDQARALGLETRGSWIRPAESTFQLDRRQFGYDQFEALWNETERPDGLIVYPDVTAVGVITSILARRVSVPAEIKLALHGNDRLPYPCPLPATFMITEAVLVADTLLGLIQPQLLGRPVQPVLMPFKFQYSETGFPTIADKSPK